MVILGWTPVDGYLSIFSLGQQENRFLEINGLWEEWHI